MASLGLCPPQFSEDVAWLPCWLQNLRTDGSNEFVKDSQATSNQEVKDPTSSQENGSDVKYALSREECGYKSCHLFLSAEDCSPASFATPENVFHFSLHLSSDVDSLIFPTQDLNAFHDAVSPNKICSLLPVQASIDFGENMNSTADHHAYEQNLLPALIPETVKTNASKSLTDTNDSIRQLEEKSGKCFTNDCICDAVELSIAASEALAINDLVKMEPVSETMHTENVLEVALRVKQARLQCLDDSIHSFSADSSCSDSLSDLNDFIMEEAYEDIGLLSVVPSVENYSGCSIKKSHKELTSQLANFDKSEEKKLEFDVEMETQQRACSRLDLDSNTPEHFKNGLPISHHFVKNNSNALALDQLGPSSLNWNDADVIPKFHIRETSFLSESVDIVPDESSCVQKHDPNKCAIGSQLSLHSDCFHSKPDEAILHSQDVVKCSSLSLIDPLCSIVPCTISSEHAISITDIDKKHNTENFVLSISEFEVDNFQKISDKNSTLDLRDEQITSVLDSEDIPVAPTKVVKQIPMKLPGVQHIGQEQLNYHKTCSTILQNQALNLNGNLTPVLTNQTMGGAASLDSRISESPSASKCEDRNQNEENPGYFVDHTPFLRITDNKTHDGLTIKAADASGILEESTQERSPLILNNRTSRRLVGPKTVLDDVITDRNSNMLQVVPNKYKGENVQVRKKVSFSEKVEEIPQKRKLYKLEPSFKRCSSVRPKKQRVSNSLTASEVHMKRSLMNYCRNVVNEFIFHGTEFLLTGLSSQKEKDMDTLIRNSGGVVLSDIPSPPNSRCKRSSTLSRLQLPIILCLKKMQTTKFLYGCAVGALILKVDWLTDCLASGTILQPEKYSILPNRNDMKWTRIGTAVHHRERKHIFERVGIMLHGKHSFCNKLAVIIKHGGGQVFKTLQRLVQSTDEKRTSVAAIVAEDNTTISRHLKHCALEGGIPIMPYSWIMKSLYSGKLLPFTEEENKSPSPFESVQNYVNMSEEI